MNLWKGSYCYDWGKSIIFIILKIMNSLLMTNISLNTQLLLLCFYSSCRFVCSCRFVYQYSLSRMVTSGPYQETSWLYCTSLYWQQQQKCPGVWVTWKSGGGSRAWDVWFPFPVFFLGGGIMVCFRRLLQIWGTEWFGGFLWFFFLSSCSRTQCRCYCAGKFVCSRPWKVLFQQNN